MDLKQFKLVSARPNALWCGKEVPLGTAVLVIAGETEAEVKWFFGKIDFTAWVLEPVEPKQTAKSGKA